LVFIVGKKKASNTVESIDNNPSSSVHISLIIVSLFSVGISEQTVFAQKEGPITRMEATTTYPATASWHSYTNSTYGVSLLYPPDWIQSPVGQPSGTNNTSFEIMHFEPPIAQDPSAGTVFGVGIDNITRKVTPSLDQYTYDTINSYRSAANVTDFKVIKAATNVTIGGYPGYFLYYTEQLRSDPSPRTYLEVGTIAGGKIYYLAINSAVSDKQFATVLLPQVIQMIKSFKILQPTSGIQQQQQIQSGNSSALGLTNNNTAGTAGQGPNFLQYQNTSLGFGIQYPNGAAIQYSNNSFVFFNLSAARVSVFVKPLAAPNVSLDDITNYQVSNLNTLLPGSNLRISKDAPLAGYPGHYIFFDRNGLMELIHWTLVQGTMYEIFFVWNPSIEPNFASDIASKMVGSFQIIAQSPGTNSSGQSTGTVIGGASPQSPSNFSQYQNSNFGFTVSHPTNWTTNETAQGVSFIQPYAPYSHIDVNITENKTFENTKLSDYTNTKINSLRSEFKGFHLEGENDTTLSDKQAHYLIFSFIKNSTSFSGLTIYTIVGDRAYELVAITLNTNVNKVAPTLWIMRNSFSIYQTSMPSSSKMQSNNNQSGLFSGYRG
jgi:hypothetical protein